MSNDDEDTTCPLCMEEMDIIDRNFVPCPCGYRVCMWCWHHIKENMNGLCPACRLPYKEDPHAFAAVDSTEVIKKNKERKQKEKQDRKVVDSKQQQQQPQPAPSKVPAIDRKHLHNYRVVQRNLVYIIGIPATIASEETLRKPEYFGQYGKIAKIVVHRNHTSTHPTVSAYITFAYKEDAKAAIQALEGFWLDGHQIRASFGTTKYCNNFIRGVPCSNPECVYLHELGEDEDRFTKEEIQAGYSKLMQQPGVVTGAGGPSGTGKRPIAESILPPPVFVQDPALAARKALSSSPQLTASASSENIAGQDDAFFEETNLTSSNGEMESKGNGLAESKNVESSGTSHEKKRSDGDRKLTLLPTAAGAEEKSVSNEVQSKKEVPHASPLLSAAASSASFNGLGNCAVFPVPVSSLTVSIWSNLLKSSTSDDLKINPYALIALPVTELFELTIPPVDAACMSIWPKPMSYYCQGVSVNGITHAPAGQHVYYRSNGFQENTPTDSSSSASSTSTSSSSQLPPQPPIPQQPQPQQQQQHPSQSQRPSSSSPSRFYQSQQPPQSNPYPSHAPSNAAYPSQQQSTPTPSSSSSSSSSHQSQPAMATLQQMFPTVNLVYGSSSSSSTSSYHHDPSTLR